MAVDNERVRQILIGSPVPEILSGLLVMWVLLASGWLPEVLYAPLYPLWIPTYGAFAGASALRNTVLPWLGSGFLFTLVTMVFLYFEAVLFAGVYRVLRDAYESYQAEQSE